LGLSEQAAVVPLSGRVTAIILLLLANAFFVAAQFALVAVRRSKIDELAQGGDRRAKTVQATLAHLDRYISGTQLGITLASLALGWIGEPAMAELLARGLNLAGMQVTPQEANTGAYLTIGFLILTFLHVVIGELAPKTFALVRPEGVSRYVAAPLRLFSRIFSPFIAVTNGAANALVRLVGINPDPEQQHHSSEELRLLVMQARAHGTLDESDSAMLAGVFDFHQKKVRDVMRPRTEVVALHIDATEEEVWGMVRAERYSRYPVYGESLDDLVGVFLAKDLWLHPSDTAFSLRSFVRDPLYVPDSRPAERVLDDLRRTRAHMAIVLDEYGGTAGIVTMEDLVEEVVGDISDEYDMASRTSIEANGVLELAGSLSLIDVRSDHHINLPEGEWTTLGGFVFARLGRIPKIGDRVAIPGGEMEVVAMDGRRVAAIRVHRIESRPPRTEQQVAARA
jgi:CBS domain containing-hemolysin-like protein